MATKLGSLVVSLEANMARFQADMGKAAYQTEQAMQRMQHAADMVKGALASVGVGASIAGLAAIAKSAIDGMDALNDLADATSSSIEKISGLEDVAARSGASFDTVSTAVLKFNKLLNDAKPGSEAEAGLKAFGLQVKNLRDMDPADAMLQYSQAIAKFADDGNKARLVQQQLGEGVKTLAPFLKDLAEQHQLVATVTTQQAEEAAKFNKELSSMQKTAQDVARYLASDLVLAINSTAQAFRDGKKEGASFFDVAGKRYADWVKDFYGIAKNTGGASGSWGGAGGSWDAPDQPKPSVVLPPVKPPKVDGGTAKDIDADFKAYMKSLEGQLQKTQQLTVVEKLLDDVRKGSLTVNSKQKNALTMLATAIDREKEMVQTLKMKRDAVIDVGDAISKQNEEYQRQAAQTTANVENIRIGLMDEMGQETLAHELRLAELQKFHDLKLENVVQAHAIIEAENARHTQTLIEIQQAKDLQSVSMAGSAAGDLYSIMEKSGQEQSALGKALFLTSKALAVAEIIMNTNLAASKVEGQTGLFGLPMAAFVMAQGYTRAAMVGGLAVASAEGGYDIPGGVNPMTQLHEREMVLPKAQADVIRGLAANGGASSGAMKLTIVNNTRSPIGEVTEQRISPTERALIIQEAVGATAAQLGDPNSKTSRAFGRNYSAPRSR